MDRLHDDYYYRLGRHMALIEFNCHIEKTEPVGITPKQRADWKRGYEEMADSLFWFRKPKKPQTMSKTG